jgi:hypothetical protein
MTRRISYRTRFALVLLLLAVVGELSISMAQESGGFVPTGDMTIERRGHTATLLAGGKVLIAGGENASREKLQTAELYDPVTGTFTRTGDMTTGRYWHTATRLDNGMVLIAGGLGPDHMSLGTAELYDPSTEIFVATGNMISTQMGHAAILLTNGKVLMVGGLVSSPSVGGPQGAAAEIYDPATRTFAPAGTYSHTNTMYPSAGGVIWPAVSRLADGRVLVTGNNSAELYDPATGTFRLTGDVASLAYQRGFYMHSSTLLLNGKVLIAGGTDDLLPLDNAELYDPATGAFAAFLGMNVRRSGHTSTLMPDGSVLITGGETFLFEGTSGRFGGSLASTELYDPSTGTFSNAGSMLANRSDHRATLLQNGNVLITGGVQYFPFVRGATSGIRHTASAELYVPALASPAPRLLSVLRDGQELISNNSARPGQLIEIYCTGLGDASTVIPPEVTIGGIRAEVLFFAQASRFAGLNEIDVRVPSGVVVGPAVSVRFTYMERPSNEVTVSIR